MDNNLLKYDEEPFDVRALVYKLFRYWYIISLTVFISLALAFFYIKTQIPIYKVSTTILLKDEKSLIDPEALLSTSVTGNMQYQSGLQNEIQILKSYELTKRVIQQLNFYISYYKKGRFHDKELYKNTPFIVTIDSCHVQPIGQKIFIYPIDDETYKIAFNADQGRLYDYLSDRPADCFENAAFTDTVKFGRQFQNQYMAFRIFKTGTFNPDTDNAYFFIFNNTESLTPRYLTFNIEEINYSSVVKLTMAGPNVQKSIDFLGELSNVYLNRGVEKKNRIAVNTIDFINAQLNDISDTLHKAESRLEEYRSSQQIMDIDFKAQQTYQKLENLQNQKAELILKLKYYNYLKNYLAENKEFQDLIAPSSMGIQDALLNNLIIQLSNLFEEKVETMVNTKKDNPYIESIRQKTENQKRALEENILNLIEQSNISLNDIDERINKFTEDIKSLPETQRQLLNYEREFQLHNSLYTFLLTKRSEMQIAKASNFPEHEILDYPRLVSGPVLPNKKMIYMVALFLGIGVPVVIILLIDFFNDKISNLSDVEKIANNPVLGNIIHNNEKESLVVHNYPNSIISESFRTLRTNFQYILGNLKNPVIMITSSVMGEGKSFTALNLATSFALYEKKVLLLSFDLRKPTVSKRMEIKSKYGLSSFLSDNCSLDDIINETKIPNLWVIPSGHIPPNPSELIASERTGKLFKHLRNDFDYILIDTPPICAVSDALLLEKFADQSVFIVRHNYSRKRVLSSLFTSLEKKKVENINIIINDIKMNSNDRSYKYGYGYGYGYNYNYN